jgi:hypothetical protein
VATSNLSTNRAWRLLPPAPLNDSQLKGLNMRPKARIRDRFGRLRDPRPGEILKDGETLCASAFMMDAKSHTRTSLVDTAAHRPGPVSVSRFATDTAAMDARQEAFDALCRRSESAYRTPVTDLNNAQATALSAHLHGVANYVASAQAACNNSDDDEDEGMEAQDGAFARDAAFRELELRSINAWRGGR